MDEQDRGGGWLWRREAEEEGIRGADICGGGWLWGRGRGSRSCDSKTNHNEQKMSRREFQLTNLTGRFHHRSTSSKQALLLTQYLVLSD